MSKTPFTPEVDDATGREAIDRITRGVVDTQVKTGAALPDVHTAEAFARDVAVRQIRLHEERVRTGAYERDEDGTDARPAPPGESPARIDRGEVGEGASPIIGRELDDPTSLRGRKHMRGDRRPIEDRLLEARLNLLGTFPEWKKKLHDAADNAVAVARRNGFVADLAQTQRLQADFMLKVVEQSGAPVQMGGLGLGDYRIPKAGTASKLFIQTPAGLIPLTPAPTKP